MGRIDPPELLYDILLERMATKPKKLTLTADLLVRKGFFPLELAPPFISTNFALRQPIVA
jgi:hypothetical protein